MPYEKFVISSIDREHRSFHSKLISSLVKHPKSISTYLETKGVFVIVFIY